MNFSDLRRWKARRDPAPDKVRPGDFLAYSARLGDTLLFDATRFSERDRQRHFLIQAAGRKSPDSRVTLTETLSETSLPGKARVMIQSIDSRKETAGNCFYGNL